IPHTLEPMPRDGHIPDESAILMSGVYNCGFVAVGPKSGDFLDWWMQRLRRDCIVKIEKGMFVDQRWVDFTPGYFEHHIYRDPAANVAYWNLAERDVVWTGERYEVNGHPLQFFHYSGFEPGRPDQLSKFQGPDPRITTDDRPGLARLCANYGTRLEREGV